MGRLWPVWYICLALVALAGGAGRLLTAALGGGRRHGYEPWCSRTPSHWGPRFSSYSHHSHMLSPGASWRHAGWVTARHRSRSQARVQARAAGPAWRCSHAPSHWAPRCCSYSHWNIPQFLGGHTNNCLKLGLQGPKYRSPRYVGDVSWPHRSVRRDAWYYRTYVGGKSPNFRADLWENRVTVLSYNTTSCFSDVICFSSEDARSYLRPELGKLLLFFASWCGFQYFESYASHIFF